MLNPWTQRKIPPELKARPQWVCWKVEARNGEPDKGPGGPQDRCVNAKANDPATWATV
jgi:primase-polymerase (primpol)-like protein